MSVRVLTAHARRIESERRGWAAEVTRAVRGGMSREDFGRLCGIGETRVRECERIDEQGDKTKAPRLSLDKVAGLDDTQIRALASALASLVGGAIVDLPRAGDAPDDWRIAAEVVEATSAAAAGFARKVADGKITANESDVGERETDAAIAALLAIKLRYQAARRNRAIGLRAVQR